jgi:hypothetical protein
MDDQSDVEHQATELVVEFRPLGGDEGKRL